MEDGIATVSRNMAKVRGFLKSVKANLEISYDMKFKEKKSLLHGQTPAK